MRPNTTRRILKIAALLFAGLVGFFAPARAQSDEAIANFKSIAEVVRGTYRTDRQAFVAENLTLTETEKAAFWPIYEKYRADMEKIGDELVKLVLEYADVYPNVSEEHAKKLLKDYASLEDKLTSTRRSYLKKAGKVLPASKVLRWAQLENRMDIGLRMQLAGAVPLMPTASSKP
jgi:Spy/CpxP family protein refolding chaperone